MNIASKIAPKRIRRETATMTIVNAFMVCLGGGYGALLGVSRNVFFPSYFS